MDFVVGGMAGVGAGFFSNPFDVVKTRMQLQGELRAKGQHAVHYKNIPHAMFTIVKHDGIAALQKGLVPALWFQLVVNGVRLGIYQQADNNGLLRDEQGNTMFLSSLLFGSISGMCGAFFGSPLQLVKTQLMSYSSRKIAVGTQHAHKGLAYALSKIYRRNGLSGLWRGAHGMMMRNSIGSASQIASYAICKEWMDANDMFQQSKYLSAFVASNIGAVVKTVFLTPMDVIMTRLYNQCIYQQADNNGLLRDEQGNTMFLSSLLFGSISGMCGAFFGSPLQLVKTQLMSYSSRKIAVGTQHAHKGLAYALSKIYRRNGLSGLWRGAHGMMMRNSIGSASQIASYAICKEWMDANDMFQQSKYLSAFVASNIGAVVKTVFLTPMDVIMTRLYNQSTDANGRGILYTGIADCARKITKTEGLLAFYKGMGPSYLRQAPHTVLLLVFWDMLKDAQKSIEEKGFRELVK